MSRREGVGVVGWGMTSPDPLSALIPHLAIERFLDPATRKQETDT